MNSTSLRGVFPEPKPVYKKNFIKENVKHIKQMQGILQNNRIFDPPSLKEEKLHKPLKKGSTTMSVIKRSQSQSRTEPVSKLQLPRPNRKKLSEFKKGKIEPVMPFQARSATFEEPTEKTSHRAVQTDSPEDIRKLYENGTIKYPSPSVINALNTKRSSPKKLKPPTSPTRVEQDRGDMSGVMIPNPHNVEDDLSESIQRFGLNEKHDYIKENILALRQKANKQDTSHNSAKSQSYQKGVLPKYLRDRKEEQNRDIESDPECPEGHVLLPEEERKETLRVLRQSYADRIQELNSMPVRNDTLRMRKRKMAIEEELKKIDEGIKVFQRPKVFVKINA